MMSAQRKIAQRSKVGKEVLRAHKVPPDLHDMILKIFGDEFSDFEKQLSKMQVQITNGRFLIKGIPKLVRDSMGFNKPRALYQQELDFFVLQPNESTLFNDRLGVEENVAGSTFLKLFYVKSDVLPPIAKTVVSRESEGVKLNASFEVSHNQTGVGKGVRTFILEIKASEGRIKIIIERTGSYDSHISMLAFASPIYVEGEEAKLLDVPKLFERAKRLMSQ